MMRRCSRSPLPDPSCGSMRETSIALTGAPFDATLDGLPLPPFVGRRVRRGSVLRDRDGATVPAATSPLRAASGSQPCSGRCRPICGPGSAGTRGVRCAPAIASTLGSPSGGIRRWSGPHAEGPIRILPGPHHRPVGPGCPHRADVGRGGRGGPHGRAPRRAASSTPDSARSPRWASRSGRSRCLLTAGRS